MVGSSLSKDTDLYWEIHGECGYDAKGTANAVREITA